MALIPPFINPLDVASAVATDPVGALLDPVGTVAGGGQKPDASDTV